VKKQLLAIFSRISATLNGRVVVLTVKRIFSINLLDAAWPFGHLKSLLQQSSTPWFIKKTCHIIFDHNSHVSWWIFTVVVPMETGINTLSGNYKICNFTTTVSLHYLRKFKKHTKQHILTELSV